MRSTNQAPVVGSEGAGAPVAGRTALVASLMLSLLGAVVAATASREVGGGALLAGWALSLFALHRFGRRSGSVPPRRSDLASEHGDPHSGA